LRQIAQHWAFHHAFAEASHQRQAFVEMPAGLRQVAQGEPALADVAEHHGLAAAVAEFTLLARRSCSAGENGRSKGLTCGLWDTNA
jgi:hypothetical protein